MNVSRRRAVLLAISGIALAGVAAYAYLHRGTAPMQFQGWVEAELLFIAPDEVGRVETLNVSEGQEVAAGAQLFSLDADLQRAAVAENDAAVTNARITYQRAQELLKRAVGSQKAFDDAEFDAAHGRGAAQLNQDAPRPASRAGARRRQDPGGLLPRRRDGAGGAADRVAAAARQHQGALLRAAGGAAKRAHRRSGGGALRRLRERYL